MSLPPAGVTEQATAMVDFDPSAETNVDDVQGADFSDGYDVQSWAHVGSEPSDRLRDDCFEAMRPAGRGRPFGHALLRAAVGEETQVIPTAHQRVP